MVVALFFFFQAEDGIRYLVRSRGLGDVYKRQMLRWALIFFIVAIIAGVFGFGGIAAGAVSIARILSLIHI